ncbi:RluA family pseudouridine synthase [Listeria ilorinensis]|uniref:RluA family pseudouridine synthase n=1 Tax=Listeria ilorinensis TaxID=2867439 RepID=UPI001EF628F4|nr:RluA family pseudouridine synthase [Listeria ilorinensis]
MYLNWQVEQVEEGILLRTFLKRKHISKQLLASVKHQPDGSIEVNGQEENVLYRVKAGDEIKITFPKEKQSDGLLPEFGPLDILFEDDFLLVLNKPAGMASIPAQYHPTGSVANYVKGYYQTKGIESAVHIVTRLDRETSGVMLLAKTRFAHARLSEFLQRGDLKRRYQALVSGRLDTASGSIVAPIGRRSVSIMERIVTPEGKYAKTNYERIDSYDAFDHLRISLETGRTHQIRVHFSHIGHPLIGDGLYGGPTELLKRQALHSYHLHLLHPLTEEYMVFEAPLPLDMQNILKRAKKILKSPEVM